MRRLSILLTTLAAGGILFFSLSCSGGQTPTAKPQIATVQKGNISIQVTGTGNLALENKQSLSFGQTGVASQVTTTKISDVLVTAGQTVDAGQVLVKADTQNWQDQITTDQHNLDAKKTALVQAQTNVMSAQNALVNDQNAVVNSQNALANAQTTLANAQYALNVQQNVKAAQDAIDAANNQLQTDQLLAQRAIAAGTGDSAYWGHTIAQDKSNIKEAQQNMQNLLTDPASQGVSVTDINTKVAAVNQAQKGIEMAQANITQAQAKIPLDQANITQAQANVTIAQNAVDDAQRALDTDKNSAQVITAPMKGILTKVNVNKGDIVSRSANLIEIAQPDLFEANIMVTERDIMSVKMGGDANVSFDALQGLSFPAKITQIAPLATVQQGVVNYQVTVELTSLRPTLSGQNLAGLASQFAGARTQGSGNGSAAGTPAATQSPRPTQGGAQGPLASALAISLKDGLSATVNIPIQEKNDILLVPNRAVSRQGRNTVVQVVTGTTTESRTIQTGISDSSFTEVVSGLNEGEQVSIPTGSSTSTPRPGGAPGIGGGFRIGG